MKKHLILNGLLMVVMAILGMAAPAQAQYVEERYYTGGGGYNDPPYRVARVGHTQGDVAFQAYDDNEWIQVEENRPLVEGDRIWVDQRSRSEMHIGSTAVRLDEGSGLALVHLRDDRVRLQLVQGTMNVRVIRIHEGERYTIEAGNVDVVLLREGDYRIDVSPVGDVVVVKVREGIANATAGGETTTVRAGRQLTFQYRGNSARRFFETLGRPDSFDHWTAMRNEREARSRSASYLTREVVGYHDLDQYGDWLADADYGYVWYPRAISQDWAPYRYGRWEWIDPWGWTWVGQERWGFAPYHYGRWAHRHGRWFWVPGPKTIRPVYGPGFVRFVGSRERNVPYVVGREGVVGWVPLGPRDIYLPSYRASDAYIHHLNIRNGRWGDAEWQRSWADYRRGGRDRWRSSHFDMPGARTFVRRESFVRSRSVHTNRIDMAQDRVQRMDDEERTELNEGRTDWRREDRGRTREEGRVRSNVQPPSGMDARFRTGERKPAPVRVQEPASWNRNPDRTENRERGDDSTTRRDDAGRGNVDEATRIRQQAEEQRRAEEARMRGEEQRRENETRAREDEERRRETQDNNKRRDESDNDRREGEARRNEDRPWPSGRPAQMMDNRTPGDAANRAFDQPGRPAQPNRVNEAAARQLAPAREQTRENREQDREREASANRARIETGRRNLSNPSADRRTVQPNQARATRAAEETKAPETRRNEKAPESQSREARERAPETARPVEKPAPAAAKPAPRNEKGETSSERKARPETEAKGERKGRGSAIDAR